MDMSRLLPVVVALAFLGLAALEVVVSRDVAAPPPHRQLLK
jgi:hypothetical protein